MIESRSLLAESYTCISGQASGSVTSSRYTALSGTVTVYVIGASFKAAYF